MRDDYTRQLFQLVDRVNANLALPADRKAIQSLVSLYSGGAAGSVRPDRLDKVLPPAIEAISKLYDGLGHLPPNSADAQEISFYRYTLANLSRYAAAEAGRGMRIPPQDPLVWIANVWRPGSKMVVWLQNARATRDTPVCRELGGGVYTIAFSEIDSDNGVLEVLAAGQQPALMPVEGDLESLLHAAGKPYSFVDFRSLPLDHWLRLPLAARLIPAPAVSSWPGRFDGLLSIDLAVLKDRKK